jgi:hypothetical protein
MFVYDTQRCQREEDDPQEAVLYFHPGWVNDQQRLALCGQLMGATQFFLTSFSCPRIIALNSGKFVIRQFGRYILVRSDCCSVCLEECFLKIYKVYISIPQRRISHNQHLLQIIWRPGFSVCSHHQAL